MDTDISNPINILSADECWALLEQETLGRLAVAANGVPDIFPINYAVLDRMIVLRTREGSKLVTMMLQAEVAFEIDGLREEDNVAWSVVLKGLARDVPPGPLEDRIVEHPPIPWNTSPKHRFVVIEVSAVSGRSFEALGRG